MHLQFLPVKEFTYYPKKLQARFKRLRARRTMMTKAERKLPKFQKPKKWFCKKDWKPVRKQWLFGMTTSNGKSLNFLVDRPRTGEQWAIDLRRKVIPFLKQSFPGKRKFQILLDGESLLVKPCAKAEMKKGGVSVLPGWPPYSGQLNPQENVWSKGCINIED